MKRYIPTHLNFYILTGYCNARCIMCPVSKTARQVMSFDDYALVLDNFSKYANDVQFFTLSGLGEPLMHKDIVDMVKYAVSRGFRNIGVISNGSMLSPVLARQLMEAGLNTLTLSIDAANATSYAAIRTGLDYQVLLHNVQQFLDIRNRSGFSARVILKFLQQPDNDGQWPVFLDFWQQRISRDKGDEIIKTGKHNWGGQLRASVNTSVSLCKELDRYLYIAPNRKAMLCCLAPHDKFFHGDLGHDDMLDIFNSNFFNKFRRGFLDPEAPILPPCEMCDFPVEYGY